jgi:hypothetical protein
VQATREVQAAGRRVAAENTVLRSLLRLRGISDQDVEGYLAGQRANFTGALPIVPLGAIPIPKERSYMGGPDSESESLSLTGISGIISEVPWQPTATSPDDERKERMLDTGASEPSYPPVNQQMVDTGQPAQVSSLVHDILSPQALVCTNGSSGQSTPCDAAARIITSMRSYSDARDVRSELGCEAGAECMVRNMDIFQLLDG